MELGSGGRESERRWLLCEKRKNTRTVRFNNSVNAPDATVAETTR